MKEQEIKEYEKAGKIASETVKYAKSLIKPGILLVEIAEKIESKILELGGKLAFPVNLSINEIAAHYSPTLNDKTPASGLLKVDIGVQINGFIADTAFSLDLTPDNQFKNLILASEKALEQALNIAKQGTQLNKIGEQIHKIITDSGFSPVRNLSGHQLGKYLVHAGATIPNYDNGNENTLEQEAYAIEPFATTGVGIVKDGATSGIYKFERSGGIRDPVARKILEFIEENFQTLPFSQRIIEKQFGSRALLSLKFLEQAGILYQYPQLVEKSNSPVSQAEHTLIILKDKTIITTK